MAERTSIWRALRWDIILLLCVALGLMSYNIIKAPFFQHASQKRSEGCWERVARTWSKNVRDSGAITAA